MREKRKHNSLSFETTSKSYLLVAVLQIIAVKIPNITQLMSSEANNRYNAIKSTRCMPSAISKRKKNVFGFKIMFIRFYIQIQLVKSDSSRHIAIFRFIPNGVFKVKRIFDYYCILLKFIIFLKTSMKKMTFFCVHVIFVILI